MDHGSSRRFLTKYPLKNPFSINVIKLLEVEAESEIETLDIKIEYIAARGGYSTPRRDCPS